MINSNLNNNLPCSSQAQNNDKRLDKIENELEGFKKQFGTIDFIAENANIANIVSGKIDTNSINAVSAKVDTLNVNNLDIDGPISLRDLATTNSLNANEATIDNLHAVDMDASTAQIEKATIDNLIVSQISAKDNNTMLNDLTVNGTATIGKLILNDPKITAIDTETSTSVTSNITNGNITHLAGVDDAKIKDIILDGTIIKGGTIKVNMMKSLSEETMQVGDKNNQVIMACDSRPLWIDKPVATLDDLGDKITPAYKGRLATEQQLPTTGNTIGDYYIITLLTKGVEPDVRTGIGYALYNGVKFDTDFFYELDGYRLAADQDLVDDAQDTAIANEVARAQSKENELYEAGTKRLIEKNINTLDNPELDEMYGSSYWGRVYTGIASEWKGSTTLPNGATIAGFCLEILANKHNTIQRYSINTASGPKVWMRSYGNNVWSVWKEIAFTDSKVEDSLRLEGKTLTELRQLLFDDAHPVNDTFVSNDGGDDPNIIYNKNGITSTWTYVGQSFGIHGWRRTI